MRRSRTLILLGVVMLLAAVAAFILLGPGNIGQPPTPEVTVEPTPAVPMVEVVVAAQNIPRGRLITADSVTMASLPANNVPPGAFTNVEDVQNFIARTDILYNQPLMDVMLTRDPALLAARGSDAALLIPNDKRAVALPVDQLSSVGYAIRPGDHVDVLASFWLVDVDREGQYKTIPFNRNLVDELIAAGLEPPAAAQQALSSLQNASVFPRLSSELVLQDLEVLSLGDWVEPTPIPRFTPGVPEEPTPTTVSVPGATPTALPPRPNVVILIVDPQQALILQWLRESDAIIDLALRGAPDRAPVSTTSVTLQYVFDSFSVTLPPKLDFAINYPPPPNEAICPERWTKDACR